MATAKQRSYSEDQEDSLESANEKFLRKQLGDLYVTAERPAIQPIDIPVREQLRDIIENTHRMPVKLSAYPELGGLVALPAGRVSIDVIEGSSQIQLQPTTSSYKLSKSLKDLHYEMFKSVHIFVDGPSVCNVDDQGWHPCEMGESAVIADIRRSFEFDSFMPVALGLLFSSSEHPPIEENSTSYPCVRYGSATTADAYAVVRMLPVALNPARSNTPGQANITVLGSALVTSDLEGQPVIMSLKNVKVVLQNTHATNNAEVRLQANMAEQQTFFTLQDQTGDADTLLAGESKEYALGDNAYWRIKVDARSQAAGSAASIVALIQGSFK
jgi:hypothetical protein